MRILLVILVFLQLFGLENTSQVTEVLVNQSTYLNCSASVSSDDIHWYHYHVGWEALDMKSVYANGQIYELYKDDFLINIHVTNDTKSYNLLLRSAKSKYAGTYLCELAGGRDGKISMQLIVLETPVLCQSNMKAGGIIGPNSCAMEPEELHLSCSVGYTGNISPRLEWRRADLSGPVLGNVTEEFVGSIYKYNLTTKSDINMDGVAFVCQTTRATGIQYNCTLEVKILYILNTSHVTDKQINDEVNCVANTSSPSCHYKWMWFNDTDVQTESNDRTLRIQRIGQHRCEATCNMRMHDCTVTASFVNATQMLGLTTTGSKVITSEKNPLTVQHIVLMCMFFVIFTVILILLIPWLRRRFLGASVRTEQSGEEVTFQHSPIMTCDPQQSWPSDQGDLDKTRREEERTTELLGMVPHDTHGLLQETVHYDLNVTRLCTMRLEGAEQSAINGLAILNGELFIIFQDNSEVVVYNAELLICVRSFKIAGLRRPVDIASSSRDNCLYITSTDEILRVGANGKTILTWPIEFGGGTLSITPDQTLILSLREKSALREYSSDGKLVHEVGLPSDVHLLHAVKTNEHFVVSVESRMECNVWIVDVNGSVTHSFDEMIKSPVYLSINSNGCVFVADQRNGCVLFLSPTLEQLKVIASTEDGLFCPRRIFLDVAKSRMFVADVSRNDVQVLAFAVQNIQRVCSPRDISNINMKPTYKHEEHVM